MRLIVFATAWVLGISVARGFPAIQPPIWLAYTLAAAIIWLLFTRRLPWWFLASLLAFAAGGFRLSLLPQNSDIAQYNGYSGTITGLVVERPNLREDRVQLRLASETIFVNGQHAETSGLVLVDASAAL